MSRFIRRLLDFISVRRCVLCGRGVGVGRDMSVCAECGEKIRFLGKTSFASGGTTVSVLPYDGFVRKAMFKFKFRNKKYYGYTFGRLVGERVGEFDWCGELDCAVCVAMKGRKRLYNQAAVIAERAAEVLGIPFCENALVKVKNVPPFYRLDAKERAKAASGAFKVGDTDAVKGKCVLLIDDISTTGTTLNECRNVLLSGGAAKVYCATLCYVPADLKKEHKK